MNQTEDSSGSRLRLYITLVVVLLACIWIGWSDIDLAMSQTEIRDGIRATIRQVIQKAIQFAIPAAILGFFAKEALSWWRSRSDDNK